MPDFEDQPLSKDQLTVRLIKRIMEMPEEHLFMLAKQLDSQAFPPAQMGERESIRKPYINSITFIAKGVSFEGVSQDISSNGMFIKTDALISVGQMIVLNIPYTDNQKTIRVPAKIVRTAPEGIGVEFLKAAEG